MAVLWYLVCKSKSNKTGYLTINYTLPNGMEIVCARKHTTKIAFKSFTKFCNVVSNAKSNLMCNTLQILNIYCNSFLSKKSTHAITFLLHNSSHCKKKIKFCFQSFYKFMWIKVTPEMQAETMNLLATSTLNTLFFHKKLNNFSNLVSEFQTFFIQTTKIFIQTTEAFLLVWICSKLLFRQFKEKFHAMQI